MVGHLSAEKVGYGALATLKASAYWVCPRAILKRTLIESQLEKNLSCLGDPHTALRPLQVTRGNAPYGLHDNILFDKANTRIMHASHISLELDLGSISTARTLSLSHINGLLPPHCCIGESVSPASPPTLSCRYVFPPALFG